MIAVVDYGAGNLFSVKNACDFLSIETRITRDPALIRAAEGIILPGVGAFPDAMQRLKETGLIPVLQAEAQKKPLLGICLGMQMLFDYSTEFGRTEGLGLIPGHVDRIPCQDLKLPHIGWNELKICQPSPILEGTAISSISSIPLRTSAASGICSRQPIMAAPFRRWSAAGRCSERSSTLKRAAGSGCGCCKILQRWWLENDYPSGNRY